MNYEAIVSWLMQSDWLFLALWIAALIAAFAIAFPEPTAVPAHSRQPADHGSRRI